MCIINQKDKERKLKTKRMQIKWGILREASNVTDKRALRRVEFVLRSNYYMNAAMLENSL